MHKNNNVILSKVFYCIIYTVSILWIIYLFIDIRRYQSKLNNFLGAQHESQKNEIRRDKNGFYGAIDLNTKRKANLYEDRAEILENINKNETYTSKENGNLILSSFKNSGVSFNLYLKKMIR